jgi:peptidoglycan hydrolase CwlO-like protein
VKKGFERREDELSELRQQMADKNKQIKQLKSQVEPISASAHSLDPIRSNDVWCRRDGETAV